MTTHSNQNPGCLSLFFPSLGRKITKNTVPEILPYRLRDDFLSQAEFSFYKILSSLGSGRLTIQTKVRLADLFFVARPNENVVYFNRIAQKHLDFLVCESLTMKPLLGIELDDASHQQNNRQERDDFVDRVFQAAGLPLLRLPVEPEYNTREVAAKIAPFLKDKLSAPTTSTSPESSAPICPKCGIPMIVRTVGQGEHKGKKFYGCQNYPRCREMKPMPT